MTGALFAIAMIRKIGRRTRALRYKRADASVGTVVIQDRLAVVRFVDVDHPAQNNRVIARLEDAVALAA